MPQTFFSKKSFLATQKNKKSEGEALFEQGLELKYVLRLQRGLKFQNIGFLFYVWMSLELIKLQGDLHQKWMIGNRPKSSSYPVCFRRRQKRRSPNPYNYKLKWTETVFVPEVGSKCNKFRKSNLMVSSKCYSSEYAIFPQRQP